MNNTIRLSTRSAVSDTVPFCPSPFLISLLTLYTCINILYRMEKEWKRMEKKIQKIHNTLYKDQQLLDLLFVCDGV